MNQFGLQMNFLGILQVSAINFILKNIFLNHLFLFYLLLYCAHKNRRAQGLGANLLRLSEQ
jgi:hypothetical protein